MWPQLIKAYYICPWAFLVALSVKNLPAIRETWVRSLGWEDPLEKGTAIHSSILTLYSPWGQKEPDTTEQISAAHICAQEHI